VDPTLSVWKTDREILCAGNVMLLVGLTFKMMTFMKLIKIISAIDCFKILHLIDALLDTSQCQTPFLDVEENVRLIVTVALEMSVISTGIWV